ncbi:MAG: hypothetical protein J6I45_00875 [Clostridia bacterium]|nr:hypothetical protein [Clostridia bacterium]
MIQQTFYKDRPAIALTGKSLRATFLPLDGAKLASLTTAEGIELLAQAPGEVYKRLGLDTSYVKSECSAFDDMFPTIDPCMIGGMDYLDHGEVCRREHEVEIAEDSVTFHCMLTGLNVEYTKRVFFEGDALCIRYSLQNRNDFDFPYVWAAHMMLAGEEGAYAESGFTEASPIKVMFGQPASAAHMLPAIGACREYKFYYTEKKEPISCTVVYPHKKLRLTVDFDSVVGYLGLWMNPGDLNGMYNLAIEPCTALYDCPPKAEAAGAASFIPRQNKIEFTMKIGKE